MELKVGMYVRTEYGIGKIININDFREQKYCIDIQKEDYIFINDISILKASENIIDIIEVGDFVNGLKIIDNNYSFIIYDDELDFGEDKIKNCLLLENKETIQCNFEIKSVITKEQIKRMEYKL